MKHSAVVLAGLLTLPGAVTFAAEAPLAPGALVRVTTAGSGGFRGTFEGRLTAMDDEAVVVTDPSTATTMTIERSSVTRVQVGSEHRQVWKGLLVGAGVGAAVGALAGSVDDGSGCSLQPQVYEPCSVKTAAQWAGQGAASGAIIGAAFGLFHRGHKWHDTAWDGVRIGIAPLPGRGFAFSISSGGR